MVVGDLRGRRRHSRDSERLWCPTWSRPTGRSAVPGGCAGGTATARDQVVWATSVCLRQPPHPSTPISHTHTYTIQEPPAPHGGSSKTITIIAFKCAVVGPPFDTVCRHGRFVRISPCSPAETVTSFSSSGRPSNGVFIVRP